MEPGTITLDRESFRALASEVRVEILKQLEAHRMTVTDLSHAMSLAKPTLLEHLDRLVTAGLVAKVDEGRKWIYYELSKRGRTILHPHQVKIMISLALSILLFSAGIVAALNATTYAQGLGTSSNPPETGVTTGTPFSRGVTFLSFSEPAEIGLVLFALGGALLGIALSFWYAQRYVLGSARRDLAVA
ncbi:MAG TPA: winged helix-turn-helix domain-containing protein [Thermoplasmata archaeon]|nr:winged helix-turn-helix domain-containing protein [Thermoplasmata archaeon]